MIIELKYEEITNPEKLSSDLVGGVWGAIENNSEKRLVRISPQDINNAKVALRIINNYLG